MFLGSACQSQIPKGRAILPFDWFIHWGLILAHCHETLVIFCIICIMISMKNYLILIGWRWEKLASRKMFRHFLYTNFLMFIIYKWSYNFPHSIGQVRYINIQAWLRGFRVKIANFSSFFCLSIPIRELDTKETTPESLGALLEYWYIERGLFGSGSCNFSFLKNLLARAS